MSLADARLSPFVRKRIEKVLLLDNLITSPYDQDDAKEQTKVLPIRLGPEGRKGLRVWGGAMLCGNHNCQLWIFDPKNGAKLFEGSGYEVDLKSSLHHGLFDIEIKVGEGAVYGERDFYEFDGESYRRVRSVQIKY